MRANPDNFRDIGGIKTKEGSVIKRGMLYRTNQLVDLNEKSLLNLLRELKIRSIIDFRTKEEQQRYNQYPISTFQIVQFRHLPIECEGITVDYDLKEQRGYDGMEYLYYHILNNEHRTFKDCFEFLSKAKNYPIVMHCISGKDRTGIFIGLLLLVMGVRREFVQQDYLKTKAAVLRNLKLFFDILNEYGGVSEYMSKINVDIDTIEKIKQNILIHSEE